MLTATKSQLIRGDESSINAYERDLRRLHGSIRFAGISARNEDAADAPIDELFVEPALSEQHQSPEAFDPPEPGITNWQPPSTVTLTEALVAHKRLVILGDPGTGKSTAVQWICASLASSPPSVLRQHLRPLGEFVPVPIILRELPPALFTSGKTGEALWRALIDAWLARPVAKWIAATPGLLDRLAKLGRVLFLVDGIDELPGREARLVLREALWWAWEKLSGCRWVATSRLIGYDEAVIHVKDEESPFEDSEMSIAMSVREMQHSLLDPIEVKNVRYSQTKILTFKMAKRMYLSPFDDERVRKFAGHWFRRIIAGEIEAKREANRFFEALAGKSDTRTLGRVPNFLTLMALVWRDRIELPDGRARLYQQLSFAYLENIEAHKFRAGWLPHERPLGATAQDMERWLAAVAWHMQLRRNKAEVEVEKDELLENPNENLLLISRSEAEKILSKVIASTTSSENPADKAHAFLDYAAARSGLFLPRGAGEHGQEEYGFLHLSFQEYFAACYLRDRLGGDAWAKVFLYGRGTWADAETSLEAIREYSHRQLWHETLLFVFELLTVNNPERPATCLRALMGSEDSIETGWPDLDSPEFEVVNLEVSGAIFAHLVATAAVDTHVSLPPVERTALLEVCWQWELDLWKEAGWSSEGLTKVLMARRSALELSLPPFIALIQTRKPKQLYFTNTKGLIEIPSEILHWELEEVVFLRCTALRVLPSWPRLRKLKQLYFMECPTLTDLPELSVLSSLERLAFTFCNRINRLPGLSKLYKLELLRLDYCSSLTELPNMSALIKLRHLNMRGCSSLPPGTVEKLRVQLPNCKIEADDQKP